MMQHKGSSISVDQSSFMNLMPKRLKADATLSSKEKKEMISERISALQQLVSPYGKVLVGPYLDSSTQAQAEGESSRLRGKGLCVVPTSFTAGVGSSNGADIWAPVKTHS